MLLVLLLVMVVVVVMLLLVVSLLLFSVVVLAFNHRQSSRWPQDRKQAPIIMESKKKAKQEINKKLYYLREIDPAIKNMKFKSI